MMLREVLWKAPSTSKKAPSATSFFSTSSSIYVITWRSVISVDFPGW
jgi:hypothetical protein